MRPCALRIYEPPADKQRTFAADKRRIFAVLFLSMSRNPSPPPLYDRRLSQLNIFLIHIHRDFIGNKITDQFSDGGGEIEIHGVNILGHKSILQGPVHCASDQPCLCMQTKMI